MKRPRIPRELRELAKAAIRQNWTIRQTRGGHLAWRPPDNASVVISPGSPSDPRVWLNTRALLRRHGLDI